MNSAAADTTRDAFLGGRVFVHQPKIGFRGGSDSVLLAASIDSQQKGEALEFGCGSGAALLPAAWRAEALSFIGIDKDPDAIKRVELGIADNGFAARVSCATGDSAALPEGFADRFDLVFFCSNVTNIIAKRKSYNMHPSRIHNNAIFIFDLKLWNDCDQSSLLIRLWCHGSYHYF